MNLPTFHFCVTFHFTLPFIFVLLFPKVTMRKPVVEDIPQLVSLNKLCLPEANYDDSVWFSLVVVGEGLIEEVDGKIVGYIIAFDAAEPTLESNEDVFKNIKLEDQLMIVSFGVHPDYRNKRIGDQLLKEFLLQHKVAMFLLVETNNTIAQKIYNNHLFHTIRYIPNYYSTNRDAILLHKE